jgi:biopolymer transport protein ExbD
MLRKRYNFQNPVHEELNVVPFLDVMITLIPFLMLTVSFGSVVVVKAALPTPVDRIDSVKVPPPFDLVAQVGPDTIRLWVDPSQPRATPVAVVPTPGNQAYSQAVLDSFHQALIRVKAAHPAETRLALDAAPGVSLERMSQLMDQSAELRGTEEFAGMSPSQRRLFPDVSLKGVYSP